MGMENQNVERVAHDAVAKKPIAVGGLANPLNDSRFLRAAETHGPGVGEALVLEGETDGRATRWGVVERQRLGLRAAVAFACPEFDDGATDPSSWEPFLRALDSRGNAILRMSNHATVRLDPANLDAIQAACDGNGWTLIRKRFGTYVLDCRVTEEERRSRMHKSQRQAVNRGVRTGLVAERLGAADLNDYLDISDATYSRQGMAPVSHEYLAGLMHIPEHFRFYVVRTADGEPQAACLLAMVGDIGTAMHGGCGNRPVPYAGAFLEDAIATAIAQDGYAGYDLGGVDLDSDEPKAVGIRKFKERMGGDLQEHTEIEIELKPLRARALKKALGWYHSLNQKRSAVQTRPGRS